MASKKITDMTPALARLEDTDLYTGVDNSALAADKNVQQQRQNMGFVDDDDPRLSDARDPNAHASTHGAGQPDAVTIASSQVSDFQTSVSANTDVAANTTHRGATGNPHGTVAGDISDFDTEVSNNPSVVANTAKVSADGSVGTHSDVSMATPEEGDTLVWRTNQLVLEAPSGGGTTLHADLTDTDTDGHPGSVINIPGGVQGNAVSIAADGTLQDSGTPPGGGSGAVDSVTGQHSVATSPTIGAVVANLVNDVASPGANKVYGTDGAGTRGWKNDPAGGGATSALYLQVTGSGTALDVSDQTVKTFDASHFDTPNVNLIGAAWTGSSVAFTDGIPRNIVFNVTMCGNMAHSTITDSINVQARIHLNGAIWNRVWQMSAVMSNVNQFLQAIGTVVIPVNGTTDVVTLGGYASGPSGPFAAGTVKMETTVGRLIWEIVKIEENP